MRTPLLQNRADLIGIGGSILCIIHCLVLPILVVTGTLVRGEDHWEALDYFFILVAALAVFFSVRGLAHLLIRRGLWLSWVGFSGAILLHEVYAASLYVSLVFSLLLALFHVASYRHKHAQCLPSR